VSGGDIAAALLLGHGNAVRAALRGRLVWALCFGLPRRAGMRGNKGELGAS